jgi:hypothetical protein
MSMVVLGFHSPQVAVSDQIFQTRSAGAAVSRLSPYSAISILPDEECLDSRPGGG